MADTTHPLLKDAKDLGLTDDHLKAIQTITDAIGQHTKVYDELTTEFGEKPLTPGDLHSRVLQCFRLLQSKPGFEEKFTALMEKHHPLTKHK